MSVSLSKNETVSLTKEAPGLKRVVVGLGWTNGFDLDASAFELAAIGKVPSEKEFIYFKNKISGDGAVQHQGDNLVGGDGDTDSEKINIDLAAVPPNIERIPVAVSIYGDGSKTFKDVTKAYIRIINEDNGKELTRFNLPADYADETAIVAGELFRNAGDWDFRALGQPYASGLAGIVTDFGLEVG